MNVRYQKKDDGSYIVIADGVAVGVVWRERVATHRHTTRSRSVRPSGYMNGRWAWVASKINDDDFATREAAAQELARRALPFYEPQDERRNHHGE